MSFATQTIRYGWVALVGVVITGTTIYVSNNQRHQVEQIDIIEPVLGTTERCLGTQITTNPTYSVAPPIFVRSWLKDEAVSSANSTATNFASIFSQGYGIFKVEYATYWPDAMEHTVCYTTKLVFPRSHAGLYFDAPIEFNYASAWTVEDGYVWTNVVNPHLFVWNGSSWEACFSYVIPIVVTDSFESVTNTISWYTDRAMMVELDAKIKELVPYYVDTGTVYDGTTNIVMLTVTGLWASLEIGDRTNKFTSVPAWTNTVTNYPVCYTQDTSTLVFNHYDTEDITTNGVRYYTHRRVYTTSTPTTVQSYTSSVPQEINSAFDHYSEEYLYYESIAPTFVYRIYYSRMIYLYTNLTFSDSQVVTITNVATYGDYPWQIYTEDLEERYKCLQSCKMNTPSTRFTGHRFHCRAKVINGYGHYPVETNWQHIWAVADAITGCESNMQMMINAAAADENYTTNVWNSFWGGYICERYNQTAFAGPMVKGSRVGWDYLYEAGRSYGAAEMWIDHLKVDNPVLPALSGTFYLYVNPSEWSEETCSPWTTGVWTKVASSSYSSNSTIASSFFYDTSLPPWHSEDLDPWPPGKYGNSYYKGYSAVLYPLYEWDFNYCKNKYW